MQGQQRRGRRILMVVAALTASAFLIAGAGGPASAKPDFVNGHFSLLPPAQSDCPPDLPLGICMSGSVNGKVKGAFTFVPATFDPSDESPTTLLTTGSATVRSNGDTLACTHSGAIEIGDDGPNADGPFVSLCMITGGTGRWAGATGYMRITGTFTLDDGGVGSYDGKLVLP